jgi:hypothetical protein
MADTQRSVSDILTLLADNTNQAISPQDMRDSFVTWRMGHGQLYVAAADAAAITIADTTNYVEATAPAWTASAGLHWFDESDGNGRLTYTGVADVVVHIAATVSFTVSGTNDVIHWRIGKNGTTDVASEVQVKIGTGSDVQSTAMHLVTTLSTGDHLSLFTRNATAVENVTLEVANLQAVTMPA